MQGKPGLCYVQEKVKCGKAACKTCPHGPYWYEYDSRAPMKKKRYVGKVLPSHLVLCATPLEAAPKPDLAPAPAPRVVKLWEAYLGLPSDCNREKARKRVFNLMDKARRTSPSPQNDLTWLAVCWKGLCEKRGWPLPAFSKTGPQDGPEMTISGQEGI